MKQNSPDKTLWLFFSMLCKQLRSLKDNNIYFFIFFFWGLDYSSFARFYPLPFFSFSPLLFLLSAASATIAISACVIWLGTHFHLALIIDVGFHSILLKYLRLHVYLERFKLPHYALVIRVLL